MTDTLEDADHAIDPEIDPALTDALRTQMPLADGTGATLPFLNLAGDERTTTIESTTNFSRPVTDGSVHAVATIVHPGRTTIVVQTDITNDAGSLVSRTVQPQAVRQAGPR